MTYRTEAAMYPETQIWLDRFLPERFPRADIKVHDTHSHYLNKHVARFSLQDYFMGDVWQTLEIKIDITAFLLHKQRPGLVFVECKNKPISLRDVSQLLGYARIARPFLAYLVSPLGASSALSALILTYGRTDILEYDWPKGRSPRTIIVARWDEQTKSLDASSILPPSESGTFGFPIGLKTL